MILANNNLLTMDTLNGAERKCSGLELTINYQTISYKGEELNTIENPIKSTPGCLS